MSVRHLHVTCAIIEENGLVLAARRSATMSLPLKWEFPGGKLEPGESRCECLQRELLEELGLYIEIGAPLTSHTHCYPDLTVTLYPFLCRVASGIIVLHEHSEICWLPPERLLDLDWADADQPIIREYQNSKSIKP